MSRKRPPALLPLMPKPVAPIWLGDQCYACNAQGLHVPLSTLSVEDLRCAICYLTPPPLALTRPEGSRRESRP